MSLTFSIKNYATGISPSSVAIGDLNGDGLPDLVTGNIGGDPGALPPAPGTVSVLLGKGGATFLVATSYPTGGGAVLPSSVAIGDLNADGRQDLAVANFGADPGTVSVFLGNGNLTHPILSDATQSLTGAGAVGPQSVAIGDLNGDHLPDLAVANASNRISILLGNAGGGFLTQTPIGPLSFNNLKSVAIGDLNGDGRQDLAVANFG